MMIAEILGRASEKGVSVFLDGGKIRFRGEAEAVESILPELKENKAAIIRHMQTEPLISQLDSFRFDEMPVKPEVERINNMAWEFMQSDGMTYADAIRAAAEIAAHCRVAECEAAYQDARKLWERMTAGCVWVLPDENLRRWPKNAEDGHKKSWAFLQNQAEQEKSGELSNVWLVETKDRGTVKIICHPPHSLTEILEETPGAISAMPTVWEGVR